jgi:hypothetical protein
MVGKSGLFLFAAALAGLVAVEASAQSPDAERLARELEQTRAEMAQMRQEFAARAKNYEAHLAALAQEREARLQQATEMQAVLVKLRAENADLHAELERVRATSAGVPAPQRPAPKTPKDGPALATVADGDVVFSVVDCRIEAAPPRDAFDRATGKPAREVIVLRYCVKNTSVERAVTFRPPASPDGPASPPTLQDDGGTAYAPAPGVQVGAAESRLVSPRVLAPGEVAEDALVFECAAGSAKTLVLAFPKACWGAAGELRIAFAYPGR